MIKDDFPFFKNSKIVYLDNGSTTQKPQKVIDVITNYYTCYCSNTHRSSNSLGNKATVEFESTRTYIKDFINAKSNKEIIFTKGVTESFNMVASSHVKGRYKNVIISSLEHHSNIVPWQMLGYKLGSGLQVVKYKNNLEFDMEHFHEILKENPNSFVSITHVSNAFGIIHPIKKITKLAHKYGCKVLVDGAQSLSRLKIDVEDLDVDFYAISSHKSYGPTGTGALYINSKNLMEFTPYQTGGAAIDKVSFKESTLLDSPFCYEAGTQNIAGIIGFKAALMYINSIGYDFINKHEKELVQYIFKKLREIEGIVLYTDDIGITGNISFNFKDIQHSDIGLLLDKQKVAVRSGHHCAMPIMDSLKIEGTVRISTAIYNDKHDVDKFILALNKALEILRR